MPQDDGRDIVIVSDLHLSAGYDERTGTYDRNEDFFYDGAFARFLDDLRRRAASEGRRWRLLLLGDVFDFLQVELTGRPSTTHVPNTSDALTIEKLDRIARGHREFFFALGTFVADGFPLVVIPGNHDIEMIRPPVQRRFVELLVEISGRPEAANGVEFHPWIYYVPGVLYAEHGQQYDEINSFATLLRPYLPDQAKDSGAIDLPLGSYFVAYLFNRVEAIDPFADNVRPVTSYLTWALQSRPIQAIATLGDHTRLLWAVLSQSRDLPPVQRSAFIRDYYEEELRPYAARVGLDHETLVAIDRLGAIPAMTNKRREMQALFLRPLVRLVPLFAAIVAIYQALGRVRRSIRSFALFALGIAGLIWRERHELRSGGDHSGELLRAAVAIDRLLRERGRAVPVYVFGHSHEAEQFPLSSDDRPAYYLNSGTWTPVVSTAFDLLGRRETFTFVQITRDRSTGQVASRLMVWNDYASRPDPLPLLAR